MYDKQVISSNMWNFQEPLEIQHKGLPIINKLSDHMPPHTPPI